MTPSANTIPDSLDRMKDEMTVDIETPTAIYDHTTHFMMSAAGIWILLGWFLMHF
jgi:hypothetical protein